MVITCRVCNTAIVQTVNGTAREVRCPNCGTVWRTHLEQVSGPSADYQKLKPSRYVSGKA